MEVYFGGAYNGKLEYVKRHYNIEESEIFYCKEDKIDFSKKVISGIDRLILFNAQEERDSLKYFKDNKERLKDKIIICDDISSGIVPLNKQERYWREETGRVMQFLIKESSYVCKIFFGIPKELKDERI